MKISSKMLNIPPYISTSWKNIESLSVKNQNILVITLKTGSLLEIPNLDKETLTLIFEAHAKSLEEEENIPVVKKNPSQQVFGFSLPMGGGPFEMLGSSMQHNPDQSGAPEIPPDILQKLTTIAKSLGLDNFDTLPKPEPLCNCMYCQIAKALQGSSGEKNEEEIVSDEDLKFRSWDIQQMGDKLYQVTNPLDEKEHYNVYLGDPLGCTCGQKNCEHIKAVLNS